MGHTGDAIFPILGGLPCFFVIVLFVFVILYVIILFIAIAFISEMIIVSSWRDDSLQESGKGVIGSSSLTLSLTQAALDSNYHAYCEVIDGEASFKGRQWAS